MKSFAKSLIGAGLALAALVGQAAVVSAEPARVCRLNPYGDNFLSFRTCPSTRCQEMLRLGPGTRVFVVDASGRWRKVELNNGAVGWVHGRYLCY